MEDSGDMLNEMMDWETVTQRMGTEQMILKRNLLRKEAHDAEKQGPSCALIQHSRLNGKTSHLESPGLLPLYITLENSVLDTTKFFFTKERA